MINGFDIEVKSTIAMLGKQIADSVALRNTSVPVEYLDIDSEVNLDEVLSSGKPAIIWQLINFEPHPRDPLYRGMFAIGGKSSIDQGGYDIARMASRCHEVFASGETYGVRDYTHPTIIPTADKGYLTSTQIRMEPQEEDRSSGVRIITVEFVANRLI